VQTTSHADVGTSMAARVTGRVQPLALPATRLLSLDAFRGLTMAAMVIVNNPGDWNTVYWPLLHAEWNGCTPTDLVFPYFLFIVGVAITLSRSTLGSWSRIVRRSLVILGFGLFLTGFPFWFNPAFTPATWRFPGVLQRIAVCYLVAAFLYRLTVPNGERQDLRHAIRLGGWIVGVLLVYWAAMTWMPVPGGSAGDLSPSGNLGAFIDRAVFGESHLWKKHAWDKLHPWLAGWDPEGILSTLPAIATTVIGVITGLWLRADRSPSGKAAGMAVAALPLMALGLAWHPLFPINKQLWTGSYVLFTGGAALLTLAACYWIIDLRGWKAWSIPFVILGLNAIALYVLEGLVEKLLIVIRVTGSEGKPVVLQHLIYTVWFEPIASPKNASLLFALANLAVFFAVLYALYRRKIFLKV